MSLLIRVSDADDSQDYDSLNNGQGKTPCEMKSDIEKCSETLDSRDAALVSRDFPSPDQCTCTNVYFNVWSACLYLNGDASSTVLSSNWTDTCQQQGVEMTTDQFHSSNSMDLPSWTFISLPTNMTFDIAAALEIATPDTTPTKWNKIQIIVPVVVGVVVSAAFVLGILIWRSRKSGFPILHRMRATLSLRIRNGFGARKIRAGNRDRGWVIDRPAEANGEAMEMFSTSSRRSTGHVRLSSSSSTHIDFAKPRKPTWALPGKKLWKNSQLAREIHRTLALFPVPWRSAPVTVQSISPPRKFEIDASSNRTRTDSTLENFRRGGFRVSGTRTETTESALATASRYDYYDTIEEEDEEDDHSDLGLEDSGANNEREHLISEDSDHLDLDEVMIISKTRDDFTIRSHSTNAATLRIPPSPVRARSESPVQPIPPPPRTPVRERPRKSSHRTPPAPSYPAPLPPNQSPPLRSNKSLNKPSIETILQTSTPASSNVGVGQPQRSPPQRRQLPLPILPNVPPLVSGSSIRLPPPSPPPASAGYTPLAQTQIQITPRNASTPLPRNDMDNHRLPLPLRPPLEHVTGHTRNESASTDDSHVLPVLSSPPYHSSPLPDEFLIARSDSPPPPPSNLSSPPYTVTNFSVSRPELFHDRRDRDNGLPVILAPPSPPPLLYHNTNSSHHRLMSLPSNVGNGNDRNAHPDFELPGGDGLVNLQSGLAVHRGYPFEATLSPRSHFRNFSDDSLTPSVRHARDVSGPSVDNRLLFPGAVRAVGYMSTVNANNRDLQIQRSYESFQTAFSDYQSSDFRRI
ncbi:hypothetical protein F5876DRAFT_77320 [Lentinula aff. lateritia]|uniref:Uncharacterized protein n=1 Tax=Lentinula aff. lateritia TaxID=2804960 RepID=A0ACC1TZ58_9AGAR|nr:hypothetical protein F5876DRAFT_77320 [Lentinula aff. lateritia]